MTPCHDKLQARLVLDTALMCIFLRSENYYDGCNDEFLRGAAHIRFGLGWRLPQERPTHSRDKYRRYAKSAWASRLCLEFGQFALSLSTGGFTAYDRPIIAVRIGPYVWSWWRGIQRIQPKFTA